MTMVMKNWLGAVVEGRLQEALNFLETGNVRQSKNFIDNGSAMRISCSKPGVKAEYLQLTKFLSDESPFQCECSDSVTTIKVKIAHDAPREYYRDRPREFTRQTRGGLILVQNFDIVFSKEMNDEERLTLLIKEFTWKGAGGSQTFGQPVPIHARQSIVDLLDKIEGGLQSQHTSTPPASSEGVESVAMNGRQDFRNTPSGFRSGSQPFSVSGDWEGRINNLLGNRASRHGPAMQDALTTKSRPLNRLGEDPGKDATVVAKTQIFSGSQFASQAPPRLRTYAKPDIQLLGGANLNPPERPTRLGNGRIGKEDPKEKARNLWKLLDNQKHTIDTHQIDNAAADHDITRWPPEKLQEAPLASAPHADVEMLEMQETASTENPHNLGNVTYEERSAQTSELKDTALLQREVGEKNEVPQATTDIGFETVSYQATAIGSTFRHEGNFSFAAKLAVVDCNSLEQVQILERPESWYTPMSGLQFPLPNIRITTLNDFKSLIGSREAVPQPMEQFVTPAKRKSSNDATTPPSGTASTSEGTRYTWSPSQRESVHKSPGLPPDSSAMLPPANTTVVSIGPAQKAKHHGTSTRSMASTSAKRQKTSNPGSSAGEKPSPASSLPADSSDIEMTVPLALPYDNATKNSGKRKKAGGGDHVLVSNQHVDRAYPHPSMPHLRSSDPRQILQRHRAHRSSSPELVIPGTISSTTFRGFGARTTLPRHGGKVDNAITFSEQDGPNRQQEVGDTMHPARKSLRAQEPELVQHKPELTSESGPRLKRKLNDHHSPQTSPTGAKRPRQLASSRDSSSQSLTQDPARAARQMRHRFFEAKNKQHGSQGEESVNTHGMSETFSDLPRSSPAGRSIISRNISREDGTTQLQVAASPSSPRRSIQMSTSHQPSPAGSVMLSLNAQEQRPGYVVYEAFQEAYPNYKGNIKHFQSLCKKIENEGKLHRSLWDDFIVRHKLEYATYLQRCADEGEDTVPYEKFYFDEIEAPLYNRRVLNPTTLNEVLNNLQPTAASTTSASILAPEGRSTPAASSTGRDQTTAESVLGNADFRAGAQRRPSPSYSPPPSYSRGPRRITDPREGSFLAADEFNYHDSDGSQRPADSHDRRDGHYHNSRDSYRPDYSHQRSDDYDSGPRRGPSYLNSSQNTGRRLPRSQNQTSKQKTEPESQIPKLEEKTHILKETHHFVRPTRGDAQEDLRPNSAITVSSTSSARSGVCAGASPTEIHMPKSTCEDYSGAIMKDGGSAAQSQWWLDVDTPFRQFTHDYASLKVHDGSLGRPGRKQVLHYATGRLNVLDWQL